MADALAYWGKVVLVGLGIGVVWMLALVVLGAFVGKVMSSAYDSEEQEADRMRQSAALAQLRMDAERRRQERVETLREMARRDGGNHAA